MSKSSHASGAPNPNDPNALLQSAHDEGLLSGAGFQALSLVDPGRQIQAGLGISVDDVDASEVVLMTLMPDDSCSIRFSGNTAAVRDGHNLVLDALERSAQSDGILVHTRYLNGHVLNPYRPVAAAVRMDAANYDPREGTPLYDQTIVLLGTVLAKAQAFAASGVPTRTVTLLITDGADEHSVKARASEVAAVVGDMLRSETHTIAAMGIDNGATDFRAVFRDMGIPDDWILEPSDNPTDIRRAFHLFSQRSQSLVV